MEEEEEHTPVDGRGGGGGGEEEEGVSEREGWKDGWIYEATAT